MPLADHELVAQSRAGQEQAYEHLVQRYQALVRAVAYSATRDDALSEDIAQEALVTAWRLLPQLREAEKFRSWLCGITRNVARSARRQQKKHAPSGDPRWVTDVPSDRPGPAELAMTRQAHDLVDRALEELSDAYRMPLILFYREQRSLREVAGDLQLSEDTVKQRLSRGRLKLKHGVDTLVERSLCAPRVRRRDLGAAVVAAICVLGQQNSAQAAATTESATLSAKWAAVALGVVGVGVGVGVYLFSMTSVRPGPVEAAVAGESSTAVEEAERGSAHVRGWVKEQGPSRVASDHAEPAATPDGVAAVDEQTPSGQQTPSALREPHERRGHVRHGPAKVGGQPLVYPSYVHPIFADPDSGSR